MKNRFHKIKTSIITQMLNSGTTTQPRNAAPLNQGPVIIVDADQNKALHDALGNQGPVIIVDADQNQAFHDALGNQGPVTIVDVDQNKAFHAPNHDVLPNPNQAIQLILENVKQGNLDQALYIACLHPSVIKILPLATIYPLLREAIQKGNLVLTKTLIENFKMDDDSEQGKQKLSALLESSFSGITPLESAELNHRPEIADYLLDQGANPDPALYLAYQNNDIKRFTAFAQRSRSSDLVYFVSLAAQDGKLEMLQTLIDHDANPSALLEARDNNGNTPLVLATANKKNKNIVLYLLNKGARCEDIVFPPMACLHEAAAKGDLEMVHALVENLIWNAQRNGNDAFKLLNFLLESKNADGHTPLYLAATKNQCEVLDYFLKQKCNQNAFTTALGQTYGKKGQQAAITLLIQRGADARKMISLPSGTDSLLHHAVNNNDLETVKALIESNPNLNKEELAELLEQRNGNGQTPLMVAAINGNAELVTYLLEKNADPYAVRVSNNLSAPVGEDALFYATTKGRIEVVAALVKKGVSIKTSDPNQPTYLHKAAHEGDRKMIKALIEGNPELSEQALAELLNLPDANGHTPLLLAAKTHVTKYHDSVNNYDMTDKRLQIIAYLLKLGADADGSFTKTHPCVPTVLSWAYKNNDTATITLLVKKGVDILNPACVAGGYYAPSLLLHHAASQGKLVMVKALIEDNPKLTGKELVALLEQKNKAGHTPLSWAMEPRGYGQHAEIATYLLEQWIKADPDFLKTYANVNSLLNWAYSNKNIPLIALLVGQGASITKAIDESTQVTNGPWCSLLHQAVLDGDLKMIKALVENFILNAQREGVDPDILKQQLSSLLESKNAYGHTPLFLAAINDRAEALDYFIEKGADQNALTTELVQIYSYRKLEPHERAKAITLLIQRGADATKMITTPNGTASLLHEAANEGDFKMVKALIEDNPNLGKKEFSDWLDQPNSNGWTPLLSAVKGYSPDYLADYRSRIIVYLLKHGADADGSFTKTHPCIPTVLSWAYENDDIPTINMLFKKGANILKPINDKDQTLLHCAVCKGDLALVKTLLENNPTLTEKELIALLEQEDKSGFTPLTLAVKYHHAEVLTYLLERCIKVDPDLPKTHAYANLFLSWAYTKRNIPIITLLIKHGADITKQPIISNVPEEHAQLLWGFLHEAARNGFINVVQALIENNPYFEKDSALFLEQKDKYGQTPLLLAAVSGRRDVVKYLLKMGANPDVATELSADHVNRKNHGKTAIQWASEGNYADIVEMLVTALNKKNRNFVLTSDSDKFIDPTPLNPDLSLGPLYEAPSTLLEPTTPTPKDLVRYLFSPQARHLKLIADVITGIEIYKNTRNATFNNYSLRVFSKAFDYTRGENRANSYLSILNDNHFSSLVKLIAIYALLTSSTEKILHLQTNVMDQINLDPAFPKITTEQAVSKLKNTIIQLGIDEHTLFQIRTSLVHDADSDELISKEKILKAFGAELDKMGAIQSYGILTRQEGEYLVECIAEERRQRNSPRSVKVKKK